MGDYIQLERVSVGIFFLNFFLKVIMLVILVASINNITSIYYMYL